MFFLFSFIPSSLPFSHLSISLPLSPSLYPSPLPPSTLPSLPLSLSLPSLTLYPSVPVVPSLSTLPSHPPSTLASPPRHPPVVLCVLCLLASWLPSSTGCPPSCRCSSSSDGGGGEVDCGGRGLASPPALHLLPQGSRALLLPNNRLSSLGPDALANLSSLEVCARASAVG